MDSADDFVAADRQLTRHLRYALIVVLGLLTAYKLLSDDHWVPLLDGASLLLHEGGHVVFSFGGRVLEILGGSLAQVLFPAAFAAYFWFGRRERVSAVACTWWAFENFIGIGIYMRDAIDRALPLVGGEIHDYEYLFRRWDAMPAAITTGNITIGIGVIGMLASIGAIAWWTWSDVE